MTPVPGKTWLIAGSSIESAYEFFDAAMLTSDYRITTNSGWQLFATCLPCTSADGVPPQPDFYWISDERSCRYNARAVKMFHHNRTIIVTSCREESALQGLGLLPTDMQIDLPDRGDSYPLFKRGQYVHPRLSGLICLQFAINNGASRVILVGMDGYVSTPDAIVPDTFDGRLGKAQGCNHTRDWIQPFTQDVINACPDVEFIICGKPHYQLTGSNLIACRTLQEYEALMYPKEPEALQRADQAQQRQTRDSQEKAIQTVQVNNREIKSPPPRNKDQSDASDQN